MFKILRWYQETWKSNIIAFLIVSAIGIGGFCLVYYLQNQTVVAGANASAVAFALTGATCAFSILNRFGAFDTLAYGGTMFIRMFSYKQEKKYDDLVQYKKVKYAKRCKNYYYVTYGFIAIVFLVILIIFEVKYRSII
ncbi:MAG: DUF3899 domain-containing protein [Bacilli bacterium]|nr:DUF3899 domain-containing protein [Bacilli bacterium]